MDNLITVVDWSRWQFAMTAIFHWLFVPLTLGLSVIVAIMESIYLRTKSEKWLASTKFWMTLLAINFAIGVATGIILEFEFGTNWSNYSWFVGDIFGAPLAIEGIMAFFLEATFVAVMFFGWDRVSRGAHLTATWLTAVGAAVSALWILVANAWMQYPAGCTFDPEHVRFEMTSFTDVLFSPVAINKFTHTLLSSFALAAVFVTGVSAWYLLRGRERDMARRSIALASAFGFAAAVLTATTGDRSGAVVARVQPMKLAAMEALYDGRTEAPLTVFGLLKPASRLAPGEKPYRFGFEVPGLLSAMSFRDTKAYVPGINDLLAGNAARGLLSAAEKMRRGREAVAVLARYRDARRAGDGAELARLGALFDPATPDGRAFLDEYFAYLGYGYLRSEQELVPCVPLVFYAFRVMVGVGVLLLLFFAAVWHLNRRDRLARHRWLLRTAVAAVPLTYLASQAGWVVAEVGRQPWAIQNLMPVRVGVTDVPPTSVGVTFGLFVALFTLLLAAELCIMFRQIERGPDGPEKD